jgi:hypothetical protein
MGGGLLMPNNTPKPPAGFVIDNKSLPEGFVLDNHEGLSDPFKKALDFVTPIVDFTVDQLPLIGSIAGGVAAAPFIPETGGLSSVGGSAAGAAIGETLKQAYHRKFSAPDIGKQAALGAVGEGAGQVIGKGAQLAGPAVKTGVSKALGFTTGLGEDAIKRAMDNPGEVLSKINMNPRALQDKISTLADNIFVNVNKLRSSAGEAIDKVVKGSKEMKGLFPQEAKSPITKELDTTVKKAWTGIQTNRMTDAEIMKLNTVANDLSDKKLTFMDAHVLKKRIDDLIHWDRVGEKPTTQFTDALITARTSINKTIRASVPDYEAKNKAFEDLVGILDHEDMKISFKSGGEVEKAIQNWSKLSNHERDMIKSLDMKLPQNQQFVNKILNLETSKGFQSPVRKGIPMFVEAGLAAGPLSSHLPYVGQSLHMLGPVGNIAGTAAALMSPRLVAFFLGTSAKYSEKLGTPIGTRIATQLATRGSNFIRQQIGGN